VKRALLSILHLLQADGMYVENYYRSADAWQVFTHWSLCKCKEAWLVWGKRKEEATATRSCASQSSSLKAVELLCELSKAVNLLPRFAERRWLIMPEVFAGIRGTAEHSPPSSQ